MERKNAITSNSKRKYNENNVRKLNMCEKQLLQAPLGSMNKQFKQHIGFEFFILAHTYVRYYVLNFQHYIFIFIHQNF